MHGGAVEVADFQIGVDDHARRRTFPQNELLDATVAVDAPDSGGSGRSFH